MEMYSQKIGYWTPTQQIKTFHPRSPGMALFHVFSWQSDELLMTTTYHNGQSTGYVKILLIAFVSKQFKSWKGREIGKSKVYMHEGR